MAATRFRIGTFNAISKKGLGRFNTPTYAIGALDSDSDKVESPHAILIRSHKLQDNEVPTGTYAIARCGAGTNNIPVDDMTKRGVVVFNTPGSNANAVKELTLCGMLLASRGIVQGAQHVQHRTDTEGFDVAKANVEKDKKLFVGQELAGKTLGVIGLGNIGAAVAETALHLGMNVVGFDPGLSVDAAWRLPGNTISRASSVEQVAEQSDYISLHVPFIPGVTENLIDENIIAKMRKNAHLVNYSRGELVDTKALRAAFDEGHKGNYVHDFPDEHTQGHPQTISMPHLGASTGEAEENSAAMGADALMDFLESGTIKNSVNFPTTILDPKHQDVVSRWCIVHENKAGILAQIMGIFADEGVNVAQQINTSRDDIAYTVLDLNTRVSCPQETKVNILNVADVMSARVIDESVQLQGVLPAGFRRREGSIDGSEL